MGRIQDCSRESRTELDDCCSDREHRDLFRRCVHRDSHVASLVAFMDTLVNYSQRMSGSLSWQPTFQAAFSLLVYLSTLGTTLVADAYRRIFGP